jgi:hypothetical protein
LGSGFESGDAVQETMRRAWCDIDGLQHPAAVTRQLLAVRVERLSEGSRLGEPSPVSPRMAWSIGGLTGSGPRSR